METLPLWIQTSIGIGTIVGIFLAFSTAVVTICYFIIRSLVLDQTKKLERKLENIESDIRKAFKFTVGIMEKTDNPLSKEQRERKNILLESLENESITIPEAKQLRNLLHKELDDAQKNNKALLVISIVVALLLLAFIIAKE